jgi:MFS family permease
MNHFALVAVLASASTYMAVQGLTYPLLALVLAHHHVAPWVIGANAATMPLGMVAAAGVAPRLVARFGLYRTSIVSYLAVGAAIMCMAVASSWVWVPLRFGTGFLLSCIFVTTDTWVNELAHAGNRGRVIGIYSMSLSAGMVIGPVILTLTGSIGLLPFVIDALLPAAAALPLVAARHRLSGTPTHQSVKVLSFVWRAPMLLACVAAAAFADQGAMSLLPIYVLREGLSTRLADLSLVIMILGSFVLMYPAGWLADRRSRAGTMLACAVVSALLTAILPVTTSVTGLFFALIFIWGGTYYAVYSISIVRLGDLFTGPDLVAGNAAFGATWGIGGAVGTPLAGGAMAFLGPTGFPVSMTVVFAALSVALLIFARKDTR